MLGRIPRGFFGAPLQFHRSAAVLQQGKGHDCTEDHNLGTVFAHLALVRVAEPRSVLRSAWNLTPKLSGPSRRTYLESEGNPPPRAGSIAARWIGIGDDCFTDPREP